MCLFTATYRLAVGPTQPSVLSVWVKKPEDHTDHLPPGSDGITAI
jgi:hypothetical protein